MRKKLRFYKLTTTITALAALILAGVLITTGVFAESEVLIPDKYSPSYEIVDTNPAIYVSKKNENSVVGVITIAETWSRRSRQSSTGIVSEGSGVAIYDGGYIITNYHVIEGGTAYQVLMPSGEKVDAALVGTDSAYDLAMLKVSGEYAEQLKPVSIGSTQYLSKGSTVIAIGNPGGEALSNTITSGIVSHLARQVDGGNTSRTVHYIQHDASISSGNSGGGLFDVNGNLVGINTLKYSGSAYTGISYEGLGFAIPVDVAYAVAVELVQHGKVERVGMGVSVQEVSGAQEASENELPASLLVTAIRENGPAHLAGVEPGDYITSVGGTRVTTNEQMSEVLDHYSAGDTIDVTVARYTSNDPYGMRDVYDWLGWSFGDLYGYDYSTSLEIITFGVTLQVSD